MSKHPESHQQKTFHSTQSRVIQEHLSLFYEEQEFRVFHQTSPAGIQLDVYFIDPENHDFNILLTSGMSSRPMQVHASVKQPELYQYAELMLLVPKSVTFTPLQNNQTPNEWIIAMLRQAAEFPHLHNTWLGASHSLQADAELTAYHPDCDFVGVLLLSSATFEEEFTQIPFDEQLINIYSLFPLYANELAYKIEHGYDAFFDLLVEADIEEVFDLNRKNLIT